MVDDWKTRLLNAIAKDQRTPRAISKAAKLGPNFISQLKSTNKEPGIEKVLRLAAEVDISLSELFLGKPISPEDEEFLKLILHADTDVQQSVRTILLGGRQPSIAPTPSHDHADQQVPKD